MMNSNAKKIFSSLPSIETPRLVLKKISMDNLYDMNRYASLDKTSEYLVWTPHFNLLETRGVIEFHMNQYKRGLAPDWGLNHKMDGRFIGTCGFTSVDEYNNAAELGYVLSPEYWGKGLMKEALSAVMKVAFIDMDFHRLFVRIMEGNISSVKLAESVGFIYEGTGRECQLIKGKYATVHTYSILKPEYERRICL
ncbi:MAG: GNAT family N-acetyltransferase [Ruminococcaceae bacterium]|nr:GNAT family N-acetyltransferase [Oscillospiraceae bacterium]